MLPQSPRDGLCRAAIEIRPLQLLSTVCVKGGAQCPLVDSACAHSVLEVIGGDPTAAIRLVTSVDEVCHFSALAPEDHAARSSLEVFNRKRDLDVLQRLGLAPGDTRRARYLYTLLLERITTPDGICAYETPGWEGCALARSGAYESVRERGWDAIVHSRTQHEMAAFRSSSAEQIREAQILQVRPHHFMCLACWYDGGEGMGVRPNDTLAEILERIRDEPDVRVMLVEGTCMACGCCDGFHPPNGRCVHDCGLVRDYKKDLDVLQKLGLWPGAVLSARDFLELLFERVRSTKEICGYGDGVVTSREWSICGGADGCPGYERTRRSGLLP